MEPKQTLDVVAQMRLPRIRPGTSVGKFPQPGAATAFSHSGDTITTLPSPISRHTPVAIKQVHGCLLDSIILLLIPRTQLAHWAVSMPDVPLALATMDTTRDYKRV
jgi:hypothetical protein